MVLLSQPGPPETECRRDFSRDAKQIIISWRSLRCDPSFRGEEVPTIRVSVLMGNTELIVTATQRATISPERAVRRACTMTQLGQTCTNVVTRDVEVTFSGRVSITKIQIAPPAVTLDPPEG